MVDNVDSLNIYVTCLLKKWKKRGFVYSPAYNIKRSEKPAYLE